MATRRAVIASNKVWKISLSAKSPPPHGSPHVMLSMQRCRLLPSLNSRIIRSFGSNAPNDRSKDDNTRIHDVIIIGGGPSGLFLSSLLSSYGIHSHLLFDRRPEEELLKHPQAHFINLRSMEILKVEMPRVYEEIQREMPHVSEWEGFHFGGSVMGSSGRRLGRVVHPVKRLLKAGESGNAVLVSNNDSGAQSSTVGEEKEESDTDDCISVCRPAHLAQNKFVSFSELVETNSWELIMKSRSS